MKYIPIKPIDHVLGKILFKHVVCPVCGRDDFTVVGKVVYEGGLGNQSGNVITAVPLQVVRCRKCGLYYTDPMPFPNEDAIQYLYSANYFSKKTPWLEQASTEDWPKDVLSKIEQLLGRKGRLLDLGCGEGYYLLEAIKRGWNTQGIDVSKANAKTTKKRMGIDIFVGEWEKANYPDNSFDAVLTISVIEHIPDPVNTLREIHRILAPEGIIYLVVTNADSLRFKVAHIMRRLIGSTYSTRLSPMTSPLHIIGFSPETIQYMAQRNKFEIQFLEVSGGTYEHKKHPLKTWFHLREIVYYSVSYIGHYIGMGLYITAILRKPIE